MAKLGATFWGGILFISLILPVLSFSAVVQTEEPWENQTLEWYYDNLTADDRQKIRQAMDYAIPRRQAIDGLMKGYAFPLATEIASNMLGYDPSIHARDQNLTKAKELLTEVFGKRYEPSSVAAANATITNTPYFGMTLSSYPNDWLSMVAWAFLNIGIEVEIKWESQNSLLSRIFNDPVGIGFNYAYGGFDALYIEIDRTKTELTPDPDLAKSYSQAYFVPEGANYQWIENLELEKIINRSLMDSNLIKRLAALKNFQSWFSEWVPKSIVYQSLAIFPQNPNMTGFDPYNYGREPWIHNITIPSVDVITTAVWKDFCDFNPMLSICQTDSVFTSNLHLSLAGRRGAYNLTHPIGQVAETWTSSPDGLNWTVILRKGLKFHDGSEVTADDVVFSYKAAMGCPDSCWSEDMATWFKSSSDIVKIDNYTVQFTFREFFPYVTSQVFAVPILSKTQMGSITFTDWKTHGTNQGTIPLYGCGPYKFVEYDSEKKVTCQKAPTWNTSLMGHDPAAPGGGIWWENMGPNASITMIISDDNSMASELLAGTIGLLDSHVVGYSIISQIKELESVGKVKIVTYPDYSFYELGYNHYDPRWGLNPHDPREVYKSRPRQTQLSIIDLLLVFSLFVILMTSIVLIVYLLGNQVKKLV